MMLHTYLGIGEFHVNNCEDFLIAEKLSDSLLLIAVFDGCTMGKESVFSSHLYGKILRKIAKESYYQDFISPINSCIKHQLKTITKELFKLTKEIKLTLHLDDLELLSTAIIGIINLKEKSAEIISIGDGLVCIDGNITEYDHDDKPDYLGYHLNDDFETWFLRQNQKISVSNFTDLSISTDGIWSFKHFEKSPSKQLSFEDVTNYLLINSDHFSGENFFQKKIRILKDELQNIVTDDLAIIRLIV